MPSIDPLFNRPMILWRGVNAKPQRTLSVRPDLHSRYTVCITNPTPITLPGKINVWTFFLLSALFFGCLFCLVVLNS